MAAQRPSRSQAHSSPEHVHGATRHDRDGSGLERMEEVSVDRWMDSASGIPPPRPKKNVQFDFKRGEGDDDDAGEDAASVDNDEDDTLLAEVERKSRPARLNLLPRASSLGRRLSFVDDEEPKPKPTPPHKTKAGPVSWMELPNKRQLFILTMARLSEPITQTSLQAYMFYQLRSFDPSLPDSTISVQAGILQGCFSGAQFLTAMLWGRAADSDWGGRKKVLLIGLLGTSMSMLGFGFSRTFLQAAIFRALGGILNGNVGVIRTMVSEIIKEKK